MKDEYELYLQNSDSVTVSEMRLKDLKNLIATGESSFLEFKHKVASPEKIAKEMVAFANTNGGRILIGVDDNGDIVGIESYYEEEFWLKQAAKEVCVPALNINIEMVHAGKKDVLVVEVPESENKPIAVKGDSKRSVYIRQDDENIIATDDRVEILKNKTSATGVTFEYGEREQQLFRFLNEYGDITIERFSIISNITTYRAERILVDMASAGVLDTYEQKGVVHYTFSHKNS
ncbi:ATP-binding protein [bacterium]|nr:ATP-binding protein [Balneola sp.]MBR9916132.1 ATP-binding protein [bacterium]